MSTPSVGLRDRVHPTTSAVGSLLFVGLVVIGCGAPGSSAAGAGSPAASSPREATSSDLPATAGPSEAGAESGTTSGDVPDDAIFLTYADPTHGFSIQYVEGWHVRPVADGVEIRDKDSAETVSVVAGAQDAATYVRETELPALQAKSGFRLGGQDQVQVGDRGLVHLTYHLPAPPDPVTGKSVPSTVDRYYVPGPAGLAVVTLSTPDGVDNVDAFRQMIESFAWTP
jgi:hypothetical protein